MKLFTFRQLTIFMIFNLFILFATTGIAAPPKGKTEKRSGISGKIGVSSVGMEQRKRRKTRKKTTHLKKALKNLKKGLSDEISLEEEMIRATDNLKKHPAILHLEGATAVIGDIHGDYDSLIRIINYLAPLLKAHAIENVLFLGDYIDRGPNSSKTLATVLRFFNENQGRVFLLRGNHETADMYEYSEGERPARDEEPFQKISNELIYGFFNQLSYASVINKETFAIHGGVPRLDYWRKIWNDKKIPDMDKDFKPIYSAIWADYHEKGNCLFINDLRGHDPLFVCYNEACVKEFFKKSNDLDYLSSRGICLRYLIHGHQSWLDDFEQSPEGTVTITFSAVQGQEFVDPNRGACIAVVEKGEAPQLLKRI